MKKKSGTRIFSGIQPLKPTAKNKGTAACNSLPLLTKPDQNV